MEFSINGRRHIDKYFQRIFSRHRFIRNVLLRKYLLSQYLAKSPVKINYGCGNVKQPGYVNVDVRWTPSVDIIGDLHWCAKNLPGRCDEVYLSHVLEHYAFPGKALRRGSNTVLGALVDIHAMLKRNGIIRVAVPDFEAIARLYFDKKHSLYPRLAGRLCGEQDYPQNLHKSVFDRKYLSYCLESVGFNDINEWRPESMNFMVDASFDTVDGQKTSLNLQAKKV